MLQLSSGEHVHFLTPYVSGLAGTSVPYFPPTASSRLHPRLSSSLRDLFFWGWCHGIHHHWPSHCSYPFASGTHLTQEACSHHSLCCTLPQLQQSPKPPSVCTQSHHRLHCSHRSWTNSFPVAFPPWSIWATHRKKTFWILSLPKWHCF